MRLRHLPRAPLCVLGCLALALVFPDACSRVRVRAGGALLPTAELSGGPSRDGDAEWREAWASRTHELVRMRDERAALPDGPLAGVGEVDAARPSGAGRVRAVLARVRHRGTLSFTRRWFLIDAGTADGLRPGLPVVHGHSLVGVVDTLDEHHARVFRVDDISSRCRFPAVVERAHEDGEPVRCDDGVCEGVADGTLLVSFLAQDRVAVGDVVKTGPGRYPIPEGLVLGRVERFDDDDRDGDWRAVVRPLRDLDHLTSVVVLLIRPLAPQVDPAEAPK